MEKKENNLPTDLQLKIAGLIFLGIAIATFFVIPLTMMMLGDNSTTLEISMWSWAVFMCDIVIGFTTLFSMVFIGKMIEERKVHFPTLATISILLLISGFVVNFLLLDKEDEKFRDVYFGDSGYVEYRHYGGMSTADDYRLIINNGRKPLYAELNVKVKPNGYDNRSWFYKKFLHNDWRDSTVYLTKEIFPGDTLRLGKESYIEGIAKGYDGCGNKIPLSYLQRVGYFDKDGFHRSKYYN